MNVTAENQLVSHMLSQNVASYMVPSVLVCVPSRVMTFSGKVPCQCHKPWHRYFSLLCEL